MVLRMALDGSGKYGDPRSKFVVYGGYISKPIRWDQFDNQWNKRLRKDDLKFFHMSEAMSLNGEFKKWRDKKDAQTKRDQLIVDLCGLISQWTSAAIISPVSITEFSGLSIQTKGKLEDPEYLAFEACMLNAMDYIAGSSDTLALLCDDEQKYAMKCYELLNKLKLRHTKLQNKITSICFADDKIFPALQAADIWVYVQRQEAIRERERPNDKCDPLLTLLTKDCIIESGTVGFSNSGLAHGKLSAKWVGRI